MNEPIAAPPAVPAPPDASDFARAAEVTRRIREEIGKAVVGQDAVVEQVLTALLAGGHVLIEGVPGLGKTLLVRACARTFGGRFTRIQFTPDLMPADVTGHALFDAKSGEFRMRKGPVFTNLLLADEINRAPAKTQAALLEVMQERQVTIEGQPLRRRPGRSWRSRPRTRSSRKAPTRCPRRSSTASCSRSGSTTRPRGGGRLGARRHRRAGGRRPRRLGGAAGHEPERDRLAPAGRGPRCWSTTASSTTPCASCAPRAPGAGSGCGAGPRGAIALVRAARAVALLAGRDYVTAGRRQGRRRCRPCATASCSAPSWRSRASGPTRHPVPAREGGGSARMRPGPGCCACSSSGRGSRCSPRSGRHCSSCGGSPGWRWPASPPGPGRRLRPAAGPGRADRRRLAAAGGGDRGPPAPRQPRRRAGRAGSLRHSAGRRRDRGAAAPPDPAGRGLGRARVPPPPHPAGRRPLRPRRAAAARPRRPLAPARHCRRGADGASAPQLPGGRALRPARPGRPPGADRRAGEPAPRRGHGVPPAARVPRGRQPAPRSTGRPPRGASG